MAEKWQYSYVEKWADESGVYERVTFDSLEKAEKYHRDSVGYVADLNAEASSPDDRIVATIEKRRVVEPGPWLPVDAAQGDSREDVREALARALYDIDPLPLHRGEGDQERIVGPKPWEWLGEGYHERLRSQADAILSRFHVTAKEEQ